MTNQDCTCPIEPRYAFSNGHLNGCPVGNRLTHKFQRKTITKAIERSRVAKLPAEKVRWREVESSNIKKVGWDLHRIMYVEFLNGAIYQYLGVSRQRAVAMTRAKSVGKYLNRKIKTTYPAVRIN